MNVTFCILNNSFFLFCYFRLDHHQFQYEFSKNVLKDKEQKDYYTFEGINFLMGDSTSVDVRNLIFPKL